MIRIGLLSDTHDFLDPAIFKHFDACDEIWHAGDFGSEEVSTRLNSFRKLRGVYGNIDGKEIRLLHPEIQKFNCEDVSVLMIHIGGYPGNYYPEALKKIEACNPDLFICGHSHILKVMPDKRHTLLHMNPGAAGKHGFHKVRTLLRFTVNGKKIENLEAIELGLRSSID
jgi:putative phosphoesterase